jgi:hypothetical protein
VDTLSASGRAFPRHEAAPLRVPGCTDCAGQVCFICVTACRGQVAKPAGEGAHGRVHNARGPCQVHARRGAGAGVQLVAPGADGACGLAACTAWLWRRCGRHCGFDAAGPTVRVGRLCRALCRSAVCPRRWLAPAWASRRIEGWFVATAVEGSLVAFSSCARRHRARWWRHAVAGSLPALTPDRVRAEVAPRDRAACRLTSRAGWVLRVSSRRCCMSFTA